MSAQSKLTTPVSVLRHEIDLTVKKFAKLIGKSAQTVTSLESGRLKLSKATALRISEETGVSVDWLLANNPKVKPYVTKDLNHSVPFEKEHFEQVQASKMDPSITAESLANDIRSIYAYAYAAGKLELVDYRVHNFLDGLAARFGCD